MEFRSVSYTHLVYPAGKKVLLLIDCNQRRSRVDADLSSVLYNAVAHAHQCPACGKRFLAEGVEHPLVRKITRCAPIGKYGNCSTLHLGQTQTAVGNQEQLGMFIGNDRMATVLANILKYLQVCLLYTSSLRLESVHPLFRSISKNTSPG